jgi:hypothetical protein
VLSPEENEILCRVGQDGRSLGTDEDPGVVEAYASLVD